MHISVAWLNRLLDRPVSPDEAEHALTHAGFPIESRTARLDADTMLDVEVTSNRGDVLCHLGCAREIAAATGRRLVLPTITAPTAGTPAGSTVAASPLRLENREPTACPRFTAQAITGVRVAPSPDWLVRALESVGQRSINNVVDVTNWLNFQFGQPSHVFDLERLAGRSLIVRFAREGERLTTLDDKPRVLKPTDLVVADAERAQSLAGVIGGADSQVSSATTNLVLEAATWDPVTIRTAARRLGIRTDASYRFERRVHPASITTPARHAAGLILQLAGGTLAGPMLDRGTWAADRSVVSMRTARCRAILGYDIPDQEILAIFERLGLEPASRPSSEGTRIDCSIPPHRLDLEREIDLIEEIARIAGYHRVPTLSTLPVAVRAPQRSESVARAVASTLAGQGFYETVTFSFIRPDDAADFMPPGLSTLQIDDARRGEEPALRPSVIPSLLRCRRANQHAQVHQPGGVRLYEIASVFAEQSQGRHAERRNLALLMDAPATSRKRSHADIENALRLLRGVIEQVLLAVGLAPALLVVEPTSAASPVHPACDPTASARLALAGVPLGYLAALSPAIQKKHDLDTPVVYAELGLAELLAAIPPTREVRPLPQFPSIERDLSIVVDERLPWATIAAAVAATPMPMFESMRYVTTFRDEQKVGPSRKSVTLSLRFRAADRTLRSEEADAPVAALVDRLGRELGATLRA